MTFNSLSLQLEMYFVAELYWSREDVLWCIGNIFSLQLLAPHFQNTCSPLTFTHGLITTLWKSLWLSSVFVYCYGEFESLVKLMADLSLRNENCENLHYYKHVSDESHITIVRFYPALLALLVSYVEMIIFDDSGRLVQVWHCGLLKRFSQI